MQVTVVLVVDVRMAVLDRPHRMRMGVRLGAFPTLVLVLMMLVVHVAMRVNAGIVRVRVGMVLSQEQPDARGQKQAACHQRR